MSSLAWIRKSKTKKKTVIIGSRGSKLALVQTSEVLLQMEKAHPQIKFKLKTIVTKGDRDSRSCISQTEGEGVFVKEIEEALLGDGIDLAVHSLKDLPTKMPAGLLLAVVTKRLDPRDVFISIKGKLEELPPGSILGTGSPRRTAQLLTFRPDIEVKPIRGNVDTRLRKLDSGEFDGIVLAAAGVTRLGYKDKITQYLPTDIFLPAVGQGALGIEIRANDAEIAGLVSAVNHEESWRSVLAERSFLSTLGGGCRTPIAALGTVSGGIIRLDGMVASPDGGRIIRDIEEGNNPEDVGNKLGNRMLQKGASEIISEAEAK